MDIQELEGKILKSNNKDLMNFIRNEFQHYNQSEEGIKENINILKQMDIDLMNYGLARMKVILEDDFLKKAPILITIVLAVLSTINAFFIDVEINFISPKLFPMLIMLLVFAQITFMFDNSRKIKSTAIFFIGFLEYVIEEKKNSTQDVENL